MEKPICYNEEDLKKFEGTEESEETEKYQKNFKVEGLPKDIFLVFKPPKGASPATTEPNDITMKLSFSTFAKTANKQIRMENVMGIFGKETQAKKFASKLIS